MAAEKNNNRHWTEGWPSWIITPITIFRNLLDETRGTRIAVLAEDHAGKLSVHRGTLHDIDNDPEEGPAFSIRRKAKVSTKNQLNGIRVFYERFVLRPTRSSERRAVSVHLPERERARRDRRPHR